MSMGIYIPSKGRWNKMRTHLWIPEKYHLNTHIVCYPEEQIAYAAKKPEKMGILPSPVRNLSHKRQWIMEHARDHGYEVAIMMDDDLTFYARRGDDTSKFRKADLQDMEIMIDELHQLLQTYAHGSIAPKQGSNRFPFPHMLNTRLMRVLGYNVKMFFEADVTFDRIMFMEDFDVTLQLLRKGYENILITMYAQDHQGSQTEGGHAFERTAETLRENALKLQDLHPLYVHLREVTTKGAWAAFGNKRWDVRIQWKQAINDGKYRKWSAGQVP